MSAQEKRFQLNSWAFIWEYIRIRDRSERQIGKIVAIECQFKCDFLQPSPFSEEKDLSTFFILLSKNSKTLLSAPTWKPRCEKESTRGIRWPPIKKSTLPYFYRPNSELTDFWLLNSTFQIAAYLSQWVNILPVI